MHNSHKYLERKEGHCYVNLAATSNLLHLIQKFHSKFFEKQPRKPLAMAPLWHLWSIHIFRNKVYTILL